MLLRDPHVKEALRETVPEGAESRAVRHGSGHRHDVRILFRELDQLLRENVRIIREFLFLLRSSGPDVEGTDAVEAVRMELRRPVALALLRHHVDDDGVVQPFRLPEDPDHAPDIVAVHRTQIGDPHILEQHARDQELLDAVLGILDLPDDMGTDARNVPEGFRDLLLQLIVADARADGVQVIRNTADILGDRHSVVVQDDNEILFQSCGVVQGLIGHSAGQCAVSDHGDDAVVFPLQVPGFRHADAGGNGGRRMTRIERVTGVFVRLREPGNAAEAAEPLEFIFPPAQDLVGVGLVSHVPYDLVLRRGK